MSVLLSPSFFFVFSLQASVRPSATGAPSVILFSGHVGWYLDTTPLGNKLKFEGLGVWERGFGKEDVAVTFKLDCSDLAVP